MMNTVQTRDGRTAGETTIAIPVEGWAGPAVGALPPHVTLIYVGILDADDVNRIVGAVRAATSRVRRFGIEIAGLGYFHGRRGTTAFVNVLTPAVMDLRDAIADALDAAGVEVNHRGQFIPHVTLGLLPAGEAWAGPVPEAAFEVTHVRIYTGGRSAVAMLGAR